MYPQREYFDNRQYAWFPSASNAITDDFATDLAKLLWPVARYLFPQGEGCALYLTPMPSLTTLPKLFGPTEFRDGENIVEICFFRAPVWSATGVLTPGAFSSTTGWRDPLDAVCRHWVVRVDLRNLVAAGRLSIHDSLHDVHESREYEQSGVTSTGPVAAPDRFVVLPQIQRAGFGRQILDVQDRAAHEVGAVIAVRQAPSTMTRLLVRRGWQILGPASDDGGFPGSHFKLPSNILVTN